jgi:DNA-binding NarL/FixJ family response regulator
MKILLADRQQLFKDGLKLILNQLREEDLTVLQKNTFPEVIGLLNAGACFDLILIELELPGNDDLFGIHKIKQLVDLTPVVVLTSSINERKLKRALKIGVKALVSKTNTTANELLTILEEVMHGRNFIQSDFACENNNISQDVNINCNINSTTEDAKQVFGLTHRQYQILQILGTGATNREIAERLAMKETTVRKHLTTIFIKLNVNNRSQAIRAYIGIEKEKQTV